MEFSKKIVEGMLRVAFLSGQLWGVTSVSPTEENNEKEIQKAIDEVMVER